MGIFKNTKVNKLFICLVTIVVILCGSNSAQAAQKDLTHYPTTQIGYYQCSWELAESENSIYNAIKASQFVNGTIVESGQIFSYNQAVGERTIERGFAEGPIAGSSRWSVGGGICMTSSVLHQAVKSAGLPVIERHSHVTPVTYLPQGEDAAIWGRVKDYKFKNNTDNPIKIITGSRDNYLYVELETIYPSRSFYLDQQLIGNTIFLNNRNYLKVNDLPDALKVNCTEELISVRDLANHFEHAIQWNDAEVHLNSVPTGSEINDIGYSTQQISNNIVWIIDGSIRSTELKILPVNWIHIILNLRC